MSTDMSVHTSINVSLHMSLHMSIPMSIHVYAHVHTRVDTHVYGEECETDPVDCIGHVCNHVCPHSDMRVGGVCSRCV